MFEAHLEAESDCLLAEGEERRFFSFAGRTDIQPGDRIVSRLGIHDVTAVQVHEGQDETVAVTERNGFESSFRAMEGMGKAEWGEVEPLSKDTEAERWMDSWVGSFIVNIVGHYDEIKNGRHIGELDHLFDRDVPVACVGAGPSLDKNVEALRDFPGVIIAADKAYKMLVARGIVPDLIMSVDCHYDLVADMMDYPWSAGHKLVLNSCADPKISRVFKGTIFWYAMAHPGTQFTDKILPALFPGMGRLRNAGCVGNSSVLLAGLMGLSPMVLVGQDFGYTGGRMFAQRYRFEKDGTPALILDDHERLLKERTGQIVIDGVKTYLPFRSYRDTCLDLREKMGLDIINCTEGGILTDLPCRPLAEMVAELTATSNGKFREARNTIKAL